MLAPLLICLITSVHDGDVVTARCGESGVPHETTIRLSSIDAPERSQPYGREAREALADLCLRQRARITPRWTDRFHRTVAEVECRGRDAGHEQVRTGMAWAFAEDHGKAQQTLLSLQDRSRALGQGLWRDAAAIPPWEWRRSRSRQ